MRVRVSALKGANLALAFVVELAALVGVGVWGWHVGSSTVARTLIATVVVVAWATVWGVFLSPKATVPLSQSAKAAGQWLMLGLGAAAFAATGGWTAAIVVAAAVVLNRILLARLGEPDYSTPR
jgi:hypothetical protein